jgi:prepilin-type N-terminal cleavage/methylation domain-containing protein
MRQQRGKSCRAFTLVEVILVVVIIGVLAGITVPFVGSGLKGSRLKISGRLVRGMHNHARSMAILKNEQYSVVINRETMEIYLGSAEASTKENDSDGVIDLEVNKRLFGEPGNLPEIPKEARKKFPEQISLKKIEIEHLDTEYDLSTSGLHLINYYPDGKNDAFTIELEDSRGSVIRLTMDPITAKVTDKMIKN